MCSISVVVHPPCQEWVPKVWGALAYYDPRAKGQGQPGLEQVPGNESRAEQSRAVQI